MKKNLQTLSSIVFLLITALISSCSKEETFEKSAVPGTTASGASTKAAGDKLYDVLGYGYDVTGRFANSTSAKYQVLDIAKFVSKEPGNFNLNAHVEEYFEFTSGSDASNYSSELSQKYKATYGLGPLFKGELNVAFNSKNEFSAKYVYASAHKMIEQKRMKFFSTIENLRNNYLTATFKADISTLSPATLVQKYGTHVLSNITLGAKFDVAYRAQTNSSKRSEAATAGMAANGLLKVFGVSATIDYKEEEASTNSNQVLNYRTVGGNGSQGLVGEVVLDQSTPIKLSINQWQSTCTPDNAALIKIDTEGLIPLEDLISDQTKKAAVKSYILQYLKANEIQMTYEKVPVYLYYNTRLRDHFSTLDASIPEKFGSDWQRSGKSFTALPSAVVGSIPIHEFYNANDGNHLTTANRNETNGFPGWRYAGISFHAYAQPVTGSIPIYIFYNPADKNHFISPDRNATNGFPNWEYRGIAFYAFP